jgi:hypothetical protein
LPNQKSSSYEQRKKFDPDPGRNYSRDLRPAKWGFRGQFAQQQSETAHVRFGSKADITALVINVRFAPESGRY